MTADEHDFRVRTEARNAIFRIVKAAGGQMTRRPVFREGTPAGEVYGGWTGDEPEPRAGIRAAVALERESRRQCLASIRNAREDGATWADIAGALEFTAEGDDTIPGPAASAYEYACPYQAGTPAWYTWSCACGQLIRDYGPELDPREGEKGHAEGCARYAAAVAAWDAQWEEDGTDD